jgi:F0F1-type ATP synthase gamma subunit
MIVIATNMKEACQYLEEKKARNRVNRINAVNINGLCGKFTSEDYKQVKTKMKGAANRKAKTFSVTKYWNYNNLTLKEIKDKY